MTDYISREMTIDAICRLCNANFEEDPCEPSECEMMSLLCKIPAADVRSVVRGKWNNQRADSEMCSACGVRFYISALFAVGGNDEPNFCPNCGAKMEES